MVKLNEKFSLSSESSDIGGVLMSLYTTLSPDELAQVSLCIDDSKLQLIAPPSVAMKIGHALGLGGK